MKKVISKDGTAIAFDQVGEGSPLIVVDGALCSRSMGPTPKLVPLLSRFFTVISYDRRGRNDSGDATLISPPTATANRSRGSWPPGSAATRSSSSCGTWACPRC